MQRPNLLEQVNSPKFNKNWNTRDPLQWSQTKNYTLNHINSYKIHQFEQNNNQTIHDKKKALVLESQYFDNVIRDNCRAMEREQGQYHKKKQMNNRMYNEQNLDGKNKKYNNMRYLMQKMDDINKNYADTHSRLNKCFIIDTIPANKFQSLTINALQDQGTKMETYDSQNYTSNEAPYFQPPFVINKYIRSKRFIVTSLALSQHHKGKHEVNNQFKGGKNKKIRVRSNHLSKADSQLLELQQIYGQKNKILKYFQKNIPYNYHLNKYNISDIKKKQKKSNLSPNFYNTSLFKYGYSASTHRIPTEQRNSNQIKKYNNINMKKRNEKQNVRA